jgi:hypothetical protein
MTLSIMTLSIMDLIATPEVDKAEFGHMCYIERGSPQLTSRCGLPYIRSFDATDKLTWHHILGKRF